MQFRSWVNRKNRIGVVLSLITHDAVQTDQHRYRGERVHLAGTYKKGSSLMAILPKDTFMYPINYKERELTPICVSCLNG